MIQTNATQVDTFQYT